MYNKYMQNTAIKKVFICITKSDWGGAQKYVFDLATSLPKDKFVVSVLLGGNRELKNRLDDSGIKTISIISLGRDANVIKDIKSFFEIYNIFRKQRPDIVHLNSSKMGFVGSMAARIARIKKIIFTVHGWSFNEARPWWQRFVFWSMQCKTVYFCHEVIAVSENTKKQLHPKWLQKRITVIHNGIVPLVFLDKNSAKRQLTAKMPGDISPKVIGKRLIGTVSELHKNKGLEYSIKAFNKLIKSTKEETSLIIIGEGDERKNLEKLITSQNLQNNIFLVGRIENSFKYLKAFDIFTLTSITEALPYCLLEAGLAGLPVIASNVGGIPEIIDNGINGILVEPKDSEQISLAIQNLIENQDNASRLASNLNTKIKNDFSFDKMKKETIDIYLR